MATISQTIFSHKGTIMWKIHQRTIIYIQNHLFCIIGSVIDLDTIACSSVSSLRAIVMEFGMDIIVTYGTFSIIFILVTTDVVGDN